MHSVARLIRDNRQLSLSDEYPSDELLPPDQGRKLEPPRLTHGGLKRLQLILVERIGEPDELFERG